MSLIETVYYLACVFDWS